MQGIIQKITAFFLSLLALLAPWRIPAAEPAEAPDYAALAQAEADWLWTQQLPDGAFAVYAKADGEVSVNPYFAAFTAIALTAYDGSAQAGERVRRYIDWHFAHLNTAEADPNGLAGTIFDYRATVRGGAVTAEEPTGDYDSTDSYAALFLRLLRDYARRYGDDALLTAHAAQIRQLVEVIFASMERGYTFSRPDYRMMYLMDNCEVYGGLCAAAELCGVIGDAALQKRVTAAVKSYERRFLTDWYRDGHFRWAMSPDEKGRFQEEAFSWDAFYPDAAAQLYPVIWGLVKPCGLPAKRVYADCCRHWQWEKMDYREQGVSQYYWGAFALAAAKMGDMDRLNGWLARYEQAVSPDRAWPLYCFDAAMALMALTQAQSAP
ncbi:MAG: hypothetical protein IJK98_06515 [Clostridia bacterium]|nr:hypothetical protein [Clostridia bacterium]